MSYTKLSSSLLTSSLWGESSDIRVVWITMLAMANKHGEVVSTIPGLARLASVPISVVEQSVQKFLSPDPYSRTTDDEGRRIEIIEGGWLLLNHAKYRLQMSADDVKTKNAERQARFREKQKRNGKGVTSNENNGDRDAVLPTGNALITPLFDIADTKAEADLPFSIEKEKESDPKPKAPISRKDRGTLEEIKDLALSLQLPLSDAEYMFDLWESTGWVRGKTPIKDWRAAFRSWAREKWLPSQKEPKLLFPAKPQHRQDEYPEPEQHFIQDLTPRPNS